MRSQESQLARCGSVVHESQRRSGVRSESADGAGRLMRDDEIEPFPP
jgi:hypothetical protein